MKNLKKEGKSKGLASSKKQTGQNPKRTPTHARNPEKGKNEEMWRKREEHKKCMNINSPRQS